MDYDIDWINGAAPAADYADEAVAEYRQGLGNGLKKYTERFEREFGLSGGEDIGGLIVYSDRCVYDYENFRGWIK